MDPNANGQPLNLTSMVKIENTPKINGLEAAVESLKRKRKPVLKGEFTNDAPTLIKTMKKALKKHETCQVCGNNIVHGTYLSNTRYYLVDHAKSHMTRKQFQCAGCSLSFSTLAHYRVHNMRHHNGASAHIDNMSMDFLKEIADISIKAFPEFEKEVHKHVIRLRERWLGNDNDEEEAEKKPDDSNLNDDSTRESNSDSASNEDSPFAIEIPTEQRFPESTMGMAEQIKVEIPKEEAKPFRIENGHEEPKTNGVAHEKEKTPTSQEEEIARLKELLRKKTQEMSLLAEGQEKIFALFGRKQAEIELLKEENDRYKAKLHLHGIYD